MRLRTSTDPVEYHRAAHEPADIAVWLAVIAEHPDMRQWVAHNKAVPLEILEVLAGDPDPHVRSMVAAKGKATPELLSVLADDADDSVRARVAVNRRTSEELLTSLAEDPVWTVREAAESRLHARKEKAIRPQRG